MTSSTANRLFGKCIASLLTLCLLCTETAFAKLDAKTQMQTQITAQALTEIVAALDAEYAANSIITPELASTALEKTGKTQLLVDGFVREQELKCQDEFFATACQNNLRLKRRELQDILKRISVEAKYLLRKLKVSEKDSATK